MNYRNWVELDDGFYPLLGYHIGALAGSRIPLIFGLEQRQPDLDDLKAFGAGVRHHQCRAVVPHRRGYT